MNVLLLALALSASNASAHTQNAKETVIVVAKKPATKWTCEAPRRLENDAVQTVRFCKMQ